MNDDILKCTGVRYKYNGLLALDNVRVSVKPGEMLGVVGPNGAGKSTLLKVLSGILSPHNGRVWLNDMDMTQLSRRQIARAVGFLSEDVPPTFAFTCLEIVLMGRNPHLDKFQKERQYDYQMARRAMEWTGTIALADRLITEISSGERQLVYLARCLCQEPSVLLLDEPTAHLDLHHQHRLFDLLEWLRHDRKAAVITVLHDVNLAISFCDRLAVIKQGGIITTGIPEEVMTKGLVKNTWGDGVSVVADKVSNRPRIEINSRNTGRMK
jgi:iron complex transport system ATP-binding protein